MILCEKLKKYLIKGEVLYGKIEKQSCNRKRWREWYGRAVCSRFVKEGARVIVADLKEDAGNELVSELGSAASFLNWM